MSSSLIASQSPFVTTACLQFSEIARAALPSTSYSNPFTPISTTFDPYLSVYVDAQDKSVPQ